MSRDGPGGDMVRAERCALTVVRATMRRRELLLSLIWLGACGRPTAERRESEPEPEPEPPAAEPTPPDPLGSLDDVPEILRPAFDLDAHLPPPADLPLDGERPQTYAELLAEHPPRPRPGARTIAILPIGEYPHGFVVEYGSVRLVRSLAPELIARWVEAWFGLPTRILPAMSDEVLEQLPARDDPVGERRQLDAAAILDWLHERRPEDATCVLALTLEDLYADDAQWVFGYAAISRRVGVHSMLRYDPGLADTDARKPDFERTIMTRALRVLAHEIAHMFGLRHCAHFTCIMNPTAGLEHLDRLPLHLCPVCLRKLWAVSELSLSERWVQLAALCGELGLVEEQAWFVERLRALGLDRR